MSAEEATARRERLKALKQAAQIAEGVEEQADVQPKEGDADRPTLRFRNYAPRDKKIVHEKVAPAQPPKFQEPVPDKPEDAPQEEVLINVAPKKANWDLKRDVEAKLVKLERRTQRAIVQIMQEEQRKQLQEEGVQD